MPDRPNVLWLTYEDTSPQFVSCYGQTPVTTSPAAKGASSMSDMASMFMRRFFIYRATASAGSFLDSGAGPDRETNSMASRMTFSFAPGRGAFSEMWRRKARAPGHP